MFGKTKNIHFVGIGGIGMSAIAEVLAHQGFKISGSDKELSDVTIRLEKNGIKIFEGHAAENLVEADVLVYSSAIPMTNPEIQAAIERNIPIIKRSEMLAETMRMKLGIAIAGTHGKTTTTAMVGSILVDAGLDPTLIIGGNVSALGGTNARLGNGDHIVVEADEFDRTFLKLNPVMTVLTTLEAEHLDTYADLDDIKNAFVEFSNKVPFYGVVAVCIDEPELHNIMPDINRNVITYGLDEKADVRAVDIKYSEFNSSFAVIYRGKNLGVIELQIPGEYNIKNSLGALIIAMELGIDFNVIKKSLKSFIGAQRRFEIKYNNEIMVIDDYAHHPTETSATLNGIKSGWNNRRVIAVFQPHLYSRTMDFYKDFANSFLSCDVFICTDIYPSRELPVEGVTGEMITNYAVELAHNDVRYVQDKNSIPEVLMNIKKDGDIIVTMGAGDINKFGEKFVSMLKTDQ